MNRGDLRALVSLVAAALSTTAVALGDANAQGLNPGFYRHSNDATVYRIANGNSCIIVSEAQLRAFGVHDRSVRVVDPGVALTAGGSGAHPCVWPDGFYHFQGDDYVIQLQGNTACVLSSTDSIVRQVTNQDGIMAEHRFVGRCATSPSP